MKKEVEGVDGVEAVLFRVPETLPANVVELMKEPPKDLEIPEITTLELATTYGLLFGFPTRYGCMEAQMKAFFDSTGQLWKEQTLDYKILLSPLNHHSFYVISIRENFSMKHHPKDDDWPLSAFWLYILFSQSLATLVRALYGEPPLLKAFTAHDFIAFSPWL
ncbi:putative NAD(P)H dehydrogenase (quinone) FQR1-like 2 [Hibiscus syriacus]|uniref:NAD(P)H dehydrogenase (Quinone) FQR1-like 2 n=1 Tax=Hibiscus syriacus TaxID=106335 RepID=A0A6A2ZNC9_HIBSY|nr:putative NAD(P)H dehydrogenase (quinone) FQR1-like 2 [Hibiscus syriacus]